MADPVRNELSSEVCRGICRTEISPDWWRYTRRYRTGLLLAVDIVLLGALLAAFLLGFPGGFSGILLVLLTGSITAIYLLTPRDKLMDADCGNGRVVLTWRHHLGFVRVKQYWLGHFDTLLLARRNLCSGQEGAIVFPLLLKGTSAECRLFDLSYGLRGESVEHARQLADFLQLQFVNESHPSDFRDSPAYDVSDVSDIFEVDENVKDILARAVRYLDPIGLALGPKISPEKLKIAISHYATSYSPNEVPLLLMDTTLAGSGRRGFLISDKGVHALDPQAKSPTFVEMSELHDLSVGKERGILRTARGTRLLLGCSRANTETVARLLEMLAASFESSSLDDAANLPSAVTEYEARIESDNFFFHPFIPKEKLDSVFRTFAARCAPGEKPLVLVQDTVNGQDVLTSGSVSKKSLQLLEQMLEQLRRSCARSSCRSM